MTKLTGFADTRDADEHSLRAALHDGDAQERVWAGWRLALRKGAEALAQIREEVDHAPDVGTRRNLLVVLAGLGEREILRTLAEHEPESALRCDALVLFWRTSVDRAAALEIVRQRLRRETVSSVVCQIIAMNPPLAASEIAAEVRLIVRNSDHPNVRRAAWEKLLEDEGVVLAEDWRCILDESDEKLRREIIARWVKAETPDPLATTASDARGAVDVLIALAEDERRYEWPQLSRFVANPRTTHLVLSLIRGPYPTEARLWILDLLRIGEDWQSHDDVVYEAWSHLDRMYAGLDPAQLHPRESNLATLLERLVRELDASVDPSDPDFDPYWDPMRLERAFLSALGRDAGETSRYEDED